MFYIIEPKCLCFLGHAPDQGQDPAGGGPAQDQGPDPDVHVPGKVKVN